VRHNIPTSAVVGICVIAAFAAGWGLGQSGHRGAPISGAEAAGGVVTGPNTVVPDRYVYYPGTEVLAQDEVRVVACGTCFTRTCPNSCPSLSEVIPLMLIDPDISMTYPPPYSVQLQ